MENKIMKLIVRIPDKTSCTIEKDWIGKEILVCFGGKQNTLEYVGVLGEEIGTEKYGELLSKGFDMEDLTKVVWFDE